jgi:N-acetyl-gamma-glutamyl-phosphate reductase
MDRGILSTIYCTPVRPMSEAQLMEVYRDYYARSAFVRVVDHLPATKDCYGSNFLDVTVRVVRGRIVVLACLDNLVRGASGVAVQNFNRLYGHEERTALL